MTTGSCVWNFYRTRDTTSVTERRIFPPPVIGSDLARRRALLTAALGFVLVDTKDTPPPKEVQLVREWLDNWKGIGHIAVGMAPEMNRAGARPPQDPR